MSKIIWQYIQTQNSTKSPASHWSLWKAPWSPLPIGQRVGLSLFCIHTSCLLCLVSACMHTARISHKIEQWHSDKPKINLLSENWEQSNLQTFVCMAMTTMQGLNIYLWTLERDGDLVSQLMKCKQQALHKSEVQLFSCFLPWHILLQYHAQHPTNVWEVIEVF